MKLKPITIIQQFNDTVKNRKNKTAVTYEERAYSWREIDALSDQLAIRLVKDKVRSGAHVALCGRNSAEWICIFLAIGKAGAIPVLLNPNLKEQELSELLKYANVEYIFYDVRSKDNGMNRVRSAVPLKPIGEELFAALKDSRPVSVLEKELLIIRQSMIDSYDMACMLFTSGTTSRPKGVLLSHYQLMNIAGEMTETMRWSSVDKICLALPMFHCFGLSTGLLSVLVHGGSVHISGSSKSLTIMKCIETHKCTVLNGVPSMFLAMIHNKDRNKFDFSSLQSGIIAGSNVYTQDFLAVVKELGIKGLMQSYGQTEASPSITFTRPEDSMELRSTSVGKKINHIELEIINLETGEPLRTYEAGEVIIKGYNTMKGYYKEEVETRKVLSADGWLKTGDIGYLDEEGNLYITGRKKELIIRCGENISPKEIEEVILKNKDVKQVKVFGIPMPVVQEEIVACIESTRTNIAEEIRILIKEKLADYKMPKYIEMYGEFPTNASGKIDVKVLKEEVVLRIQEKA